MTRATDEVIQTAIDDFIVCALDNYEPPDAAPIVGLDLRQQQIEAMKLK